MSKKGLNIHLVEPSQCVNRRPGSSQQVFKGPRGIHSSSVVCLYRKSKNIVLKPICLNNELPKTIRNSRMKGMMSVKGTLGKGKKEVSPLGGSHS